MIIDTKKDISTQLKELSDVSFECECSNTHTSSIKEIVIKKDALKELPRVLSDFKNKQILMVSDKNTYKACGEKVLYILKDYNIRSFIFPDEYIDSNLHYTGRLLIEVNPQIDFILAVGSGVINDMSRTVSFRSKIPYAIVATASSMDGYASTVSPTFVDGNKFSVPGTTPIAIIGDLDVLENAPPIMLKAGFGDVLGKIIARADWDLAALEKGTHQCSLCREIVFKAYQECIDNIDGVKTNSEKATGAVIQALILSGIVMTFYKDSRPASGCEHFFGHYWDIAAILENRMHPLHGISVGVGSYVAAIIYDKVKEYLPSDFAYPKADEIKYMLDYIKAPSSPIELGLSREVFYNSIRLAWHNKPSRYTVLQFARDKGILDDIAEEVTNMFYK